MKKSTAIVLSIVFVAHCLSAGMLCCLPAQAQSYRYMDKAGNIFWVDSIDQVPPQYKDQVLKPTPKPVLSKKQQRQIEAEKRRIEKEKEKAQRAKEKKKKQLEKERHRKSKEKAEKEQGQEDIRASEPAPNVSQAPRDTAQSQDAENPQELEDQPEGQSDG